MPLLLCACLLFPVFALAAPFAGENPMDEALARARLEKEKRAISAMMDTVLPDLRKNGDGVMLGNWLVHPEGFALLIPEGFARLGRYQGTTLMLVDRNPGNSKSSTSISVTVTEPDKRMKTMSRSQVQHAYDGLFERFTLLGFDRETVDGNDCLRLSFLSGRQPRLFFLQYLFEKNGRFYVVTLMAENKMPSVSKALRSFTAFSNSLVFAGE